VRLLFDEQLSSRLCSMLASDYPDSLHVGPIGLGGGPDEAVWRAAAERGCVLVTKDEDFHRLSVLRGAPPKVIWIRLGNAPTEEIARLLRERREDILRFESQDDATFLSLGW
jgi:predicted nuclease of predicted toxin-antitoxin system